MNELLYKYRGLDNFKNFVDIILKNRLYAARYKDLNDPMEGQYYYRHGELNQRIKEKIRDEKGELRICSLSKVRNNELMWSHYANGQKGVAIGVKITDQNYIAENVQYNGIIYVRDQDYNHQTARQILCHKLDVWAYEEEKRIFTMNERYVKISVHEIITGRKMNTRDINLVTELIEKINPNIKIIRADEIM
ncbi:DUF2971 domain-containing protein [Aquimarina spinulae]|uniref:DUF2971 domain-containing protein n=1 Tax=Aquimarina spinulae TaxID=1192023 RepID=UPI000D55A63F|nr:DUF2971 domain-containing protein [Aquimarina spinulae]